MTEWLVYEHFHVTGQTELLYYVNSWDACFFSEIMVICFL